MDKTYLELLAENDEEARKEFQPNAKDLLVANYVEYDDIVGGDDEYPDEIENKHEFDRLQGSHQAAALLPEPEKDLHKTTTNVRYDKDVQIHVISIDSRFRTDQLDNPSNFLFKLLTPIKNVISIRLSSVEIPNTWYTFSELRGNTSMIVRISPPSSSTPQVVITGRVVIQEGNYYVNTGQTNDLLVELFNQLNATFITNSFAVFFNTISGKLSISCFTKKHPPVGGYTYTNQPSSATETPTNFYMNFADSIYSTREDNWGLGYNLGFRIKETDYLTVHNAESIVDVIDVNYVFLSLNPDWRVVEHLQTDTSQTAAFAKIVIDVPKNEIVYDNGSNTITKQYYLKQPINVSTFNIAVLDEYDQYIQLEGGNVSMTLEITEVLHASLYEAMRV
jgi:hypothetical protein